MGRVKSEVFPNARENQTDMHGKRIPIAESFSIQGKGQSRICGKKMNVYNAHNCDMKD